MKKGKTFYQNPKIDFLFGFFDGQPIPPKHDQFKPIEAVEVDEKGNQVIINNLYERKQGKNSVIEFQELLRNTFLKKFKNDIRIRAPHSLEVILSVSIKKNRFSSVDVDNIAKTILDGLEGVAYDNDAQVSSLIVKKHIHPMNCNGILIGITKLTKKRQGVGGDINLFG